MKIWKIAQKIGGYDDYWILPNGEIVNVTIEGHTEYFSNNYTKFGITAKEMEELNNSGMSYYDKAFDKGAVRVSVSPYRGTSINGKLSKIRENAHNIHKLAKKNKSNKFICEFSDYKIQEREMSIEDIYNI
jgi:hypothetical protein